MPLNLRRLTPLAAIAALALPLAACGSDDSSSGASTSGKASSDGGSVTLYNAQHEDLMKLMTAQFTKETGITVKMRNGDDLEMANQIVQEGDASPADVFATENSPGMTLVDRAGRFAKLDDATLAQVPAQYSPTNGNWTGFAARSTVFVYNTTKLKSGDLPKSLLDLADPKWKGRFGYSPTGADFQAIVSAVLALKGEAATKAWLAGLKANAEPFDGNSTVMKAVSDGKVEGGVIYHYYWYQDQAEAGDNSKDTKLHFFGNQDPGAFTSVSGAGVLKSSKNQANAQKLVRFLSSRSGQRVLADSSALEYTLADGVAANKALPPLKSLDAPKVDVTDLNSQKVIELMQDAGIL